MAYRLVAVKKNTKDRIDSLAKKLGIKKYEVIDMAIKLLEQKDNMCIIEISPSVYKELVKIMDLLRLESFDDVIRALIRIPKVIYNDELRLCDALKPLDELERMIEKRVDAKQ